MMMANVTKIYKRLKSLLINPYLNHSDAAALVLLKRHYYICFMLLSENHVFLNEWLPVVAIQAVRIVNADRVALGREAVATAVVLLLGVAGEDHGLLLGVVRLVALDGHVFVDSEFMNFFVV